MFITQSFSRLETEAWRWETSPESRNTSEHTVFRLGTWTEPQPQSTWASLARTDLTGKAFPTELTDRRKQSDSKNNSSNKIQFKRTLSLFFKAFTRHRVQLWLIIRYVFAGFTISWSQNEFCSHLHWFKDLTHLHLWCVANFVGVLVPKQLNTSPD